MEMRNSELAPLPPPPRAVGALVNGFNAVAANVAVIFFPVVFDLLLWLGPRFGLKSGMLLGPLQQLSTDLQAQVPVEQMRLFTQMVTDIQNGYNLLSVLRTFPLGIFSLLNTNLAVNSPLGLRPAVLLPNWFIVLGAMLVLTFFGWLAGSFYFNAVARVALKPPKAPGLIWSVVNSLMLSALWLLLMAIAYIPVGLFALLLNLLDSGIRLIVMFLLVFPASWLLLAVFFSFHGIFVDSRNGFASALNSFRMLRYALPPLGWFAMLALIINQGMNLLWTVPPAESWMMGIGILGHAFVSTSLLAASFIYYRDLNTWINKAMEWVKKQKVLSARA